MIAWLATNLVAAALLPPLLLVLFLATGLILHRRSPRLATSLILLATTALYGLPTFAGLRDRSFALHEWLGILWYKLRSIFA